MQCPKCNQPGYHSNKPCTHCRFRGDPELVAELGRVEWLLQEVKTWQQYGATHTFIQRILKKYALRRRELQIQLGLRLPPYPIEQVPAVWTQFNQLEFIIRELSSWQHEKLISITGSQKIIERLRRRISKIRERLAGTKPRYFALSDAAYLNAFHGLQKIAD
ncbi:MAG: hypothetical protein GY805_29060, partial [Chloroflexi bacterium]|nr:hypothetical protein [Chloroflexota bacterium]